MAKRVEVVEALRGRRDDGKPAPDCPFIALGENNGQYRFIVANGQIRDFSARELGSPAFLLSIVGGDPSWLETTFRCFDKDGVELQHGFNTKAATAGLMRMCAAAGIFDPEMPVRGRGVWPLGEDLLYNAGDKLYFGDGTERRAGTRRACRNTPTMAQ